MFYTLVFFSSGSKWHSHRKLLTPTFHFKILDNFMEAFVNKSLVFVNVLEKHVGKESFDVYPYVTMCALDIICGKYDCIFIFILLFFSK